ncbi:MAG: CpaE family protein [Acidimicrobiia bacterium]
MTIRVATVLSARDWEPQLVAHAHDTAAIRIVLRAFQPSDIERHSTDIDVVVAGGDVAWVTPRQISTWKRLGLGVVGMFPMGDQPAADLLEAGGANEVVPDTINPEALVQAIRFVAPHAQTARTDDRGTITAVVGSRGAPGCTEVALAYSLARAISRATVLIDMDLDAPSIAVRLGLAPRPDIADAASSVRVDGGIDASAIRTYEAVSVITGSHRPGQPGISAIMTQGVLDAARNEFEEVVVDLGAIQPGNDIVAEASRAIVVIDASAIGIVRAAQLTSAWVGPTPYVVLNRVQPHKVNDAIDAVRTWTGLEPAAVIPDHQSVRRATIAARRPNRRLTRALAGMDVS